MLYVIKAGLVDLPSVSATSELDTLRDQIIPWPKKVPSLPITPTCHVSPTDERSRDPFWQVVRHEENF